MVLTGPDVAVEKARRMEKSDFCSRKSRALPDAGGSFSRQPLFVVTRSSS